MILSDLSNPLQKCVIGDICSFLDEWRERSGSVPIKDLHLQVSVISVYVVDHYK